MTRGGLSSLFLSTIASVHLPHAAQGAASTTDRNYRTRRDNKLLYPTCCTLLVIAPIAEAISIWLNHSYATPCPFVPPLTNEVDLPVVGVEQS